MTTFNIKRFKEIDTQELESKLEVIERTIKPTQFTISNGDINFVVNTLGINELNTLEGLTSLRNAIVLHYQKIIEKCDRGAYGSGWQRYFIFLTAITHCVDVRLADLGLMY